jgi:hypothetical protein
LAIHEFDFTAKQIFWGNILFLLCCGFYLAWWLLAFKPTGAITGMKTAWLLIPATAAGFAAVVWTAKGILSASVQKAIFPGGLLLWGGILGYLLLLIVTRLFFHRPATTELILIVGWAILALTELNTLYGVGRFSHQPTCIYAVVIGLVTLLNLVCYTLYYQLGPKASYIDGMIPLVTAALYTACISVAMAI